MTLELADFIGREIFVDAMRVGMSCISLAMPRFGILLPRTSRRRTLPVAFFMLRAGVVVVAAPSLVVRCLFAFLPDSSPRLTSSGKGGSPGFLMSQRLVVSIVVFSLGWFFCVEEADLFVKELAKLATLSFLMTVDAELRTRFSPRDFTVILGNGRTSLLHTSDRSASSRALSPLGGASTGILIVVANKE